MVFLTLGDRYSGVIASQVLDAAAFLRDELGEKVLVIAFISIRQFFPQRAKFKQNHPHTWVVPMFPGLHRWRANRWLLAALLRFSGQQKILCRNVLATNLALSLRERSLVKQVMFDGRGAIQAEWREYEVVSHPALKQEIFELEKKAVLATNWRIGVSEALVQYWRETFGYSEHAHSVIPCTVNPEFLKPLPPIEARHTSRQKYGFAPDDVVLVYAGSSAGWQSFEKLDKWLLQLMNKDERIRVLFLAKLDLPELICYQAYPDRVQKDWLSPDEVPKTLSIGDYGLLIREESVTNQVASPTKFAEYLCAGLQILISPSIGDYSALTEDQQLGQVVDLSQSTSPDLSPAGEDRKQLLHEFGKTHFSKLSYLPAYQSLLALPASHLS